MDSRHQLDSLKRQLYDNSSSTQLEAVVEYAKLSLEEVKSELLVCSLTEFEKLQGKAEAYRDLIRVITEQPVKYN